LPRPRALASLLLPLLLTANPARGGESTLFGFTPFPYDLTAQAQQATDEIVRANSTIHALHFDDGVPWSEALADAPFPGRVTREWEEAARRLPRDRPLYLGLTPLAKDRKSLAGYRGDRDGVPMPRQFQGARLDDPNVKQAYLNFVRRAVRTFHPTFLNVGIEAGAILGRDPGQWDAFQSLFRHVRSGLRQEFPEVKVGISFELSSLRRPRNAERARALIELSDFLGLSFYPHMGAFYAKLGDPLLGKGEASWREPLDWVAKYAVKPIAICETGYSSQDVSLRSHGLSLTGDESLQAAYVRDLAALARRDRYLFVIWFLVADYDLLYAKLPDTPDKEVNGLWKNIGLLGGQLREKPAWQEWIRAVRPDARSVPGAASPSRQRPAEDAFACGGPDSKVGTATEGPHGQAATRWSYAYRDMEWNWCTRAIAGDRVAGAAALRFWIRSDRPGPLFVQLEEKGGETFFAMVDVGDEWREVVLDLSRLTPDPKKRQDGRLQASQIAGLLVADEGATKGQVGRRTVWIADVAFR
jgi:hypothetical protein